MLEIIVVGQDDTTELFRSDGIFKVEFFLDEHSDAENDHFTVMVGAMVYTVENWRKAYAEHLAS